MTETIIVLIISGAVFWGITEIRRRAYMARNAAAGQRGRCVDCKYCRYDGTGEISETGFFCRLSKRDYITEATVMDCVDPATITKREIAEILKADQWTAEGCAYIQESLLGKKMGWTGVEEFLSRLPQEHPEYIK